MGHLHGANFATRSAEARLRIRISELPSEVLPEPRQSQAQPNIAAAEKKITSPLRRRAVLPAQAAAELECGVLTEPRTAT